MEWHSPTNSPASPETERTTAAAVNTAAGGVRFSETISGSSNLQDTVGQPTASAAAAAASGDSLPSPNASASPSPITTGEAMDAVAAQCERRGLTNAATWLSEMSLHALPSVLAAPLPTTSSLASVVSELDKQAVHLTSPSSSSSLQQQQQQQHFQRLHRVALGYFTRGEFQRCHLTILREVMRTREPNSAFSSAAAAAAMEKEEETSSSTVDNAPSSLPSPEVVRGFRTTALPPLLQFLSLYALFMDGMKVKQLSNNANSCTGAGGPQRAVHPHAHVLRAYLLEAMRNPINTLRLAAAQTEAVPPSRPSSDTHAVCGDANTDVHNSHNDSASRSVNREGRSCTAPPSRLLEGTAVADGWDPHTPSTKKQPWTITSASRVPGVKGTTAGPVMGGGSSAFSRTDGGSVGSHTFSNFSPATTVERSAPSGGRHDAAPTAAPPPPPPPLSASPNIVAADLLHLDPYLTWLMGVVLRELRMRQECATFLLAAVTVNPLLRCAWEDLTSLVSREAQLVELDSVLEDVEPYFMTDIFAAEVRGLLGVSPMSSTRLRNAAAVAAVAMGNNVGEGREVRLGGALGVVSPPPPPPPSSSASRSAVPLFVASPHTLNGAVGLDGNAETPNLVQARSTPQQHANDTNSINGNPPAGVAPPLLSSPIVPSTSAAAFANAWECLGLLFPDTPSLLSQLAHFYYHQRNRLDKAEAIYQRIRKLDPHYYGILYDYSNVLYTKRDRLGLSSLVQAVYHADAFRAETNFAVGNYYVLLGQHDRAALHFHRTTAIDPQCAEAWLLLGHAYVEVKNTTAAVEAYRTAVELNERDYRGWYNLGQIYELLEAYHHALYYYWHTTSLRPADPGMWVAVANCLEHDGRVGESIACLERAETYDANTSPNYPVYVRRIATHHIANSSFTRACVYLEKLVQSPAATGEDLLLALPFLIQHYVQRARKSLELPARSSSYDPALFSPGLNLSPASSPASASAGRTALHHARAAAALQHLHKAEEHLEAMAELVMPVGTSLLSAADGPPPQQDTAGETAPMARLENFTDDVTASGKRRSKQSSGGLASYRTNATTGFATPSTTTNGSAAAAGVDGGGGQLPPVAFVRSRHREINALRTQAMQLLHPPTLSQLSVPSSMPSSSSVAGTAHANQKGFFSTHTVERH